MRTKKKAATGISHVLVRMVGDANQLAFDEEDEIWGSGGEKLELAGILEALSDAGGWIEYETEVRQEPEEDWRDSGEWLRATHRIFARSVESVAVVYL